MRRLSNRDVELDVTTEVGPRILRYALAGGENVFAELPAAAIDTPFGPFAVRGGHRLWAAPEAMPRTYVPDDAPVRVREGLEGDHTLTLTQPADDFARLERSIAIRLDPSGTGVRVAHRLVNRGPWPIEAAPWALSIMRPGGVGILPQEPFGPHPENLLPARAMVLWPFTDLADPRWQFGSRLLRVRCDPSRDAPQKIGISNTLGWAAYATGDLLFVKRFRWQPDATYPDRGCNTEIFTAGSFFELESLGPLSTIEPGASAEHHERWELIDTRGIDTADDDAVLAAIEGAGKRLLS